MKILSILLLFILFSSSLFAKECVVISGNKKDDKQVFKDVPILKGPTKVGDFNCKVFDSWELADAYVAKLPAGGELLVVQGAHGDAGGNATCNASDVTGDQILGYLDKFTTKFKVGSIIDSCYSGDLLKKKLIDDADKNKTAEQLQKLCLITTSAPGKVSYGTDFLTDLTKKDQSGVDLENILLKYSGIYSTAAAWDSVGVTGYWKQLDQKLAGKVLTNFSKLLNDSQYVCNDNSKNLATVCSKPQMDAVVISDLINYFSLDEKQDELLEKDNLMVKATIQILEEKKQLNELEKAKLACLKQASPLLDQEDKANLFNKLGWSLVRKYKSGTEEAPCMKWARLEKTTPKKAEIDVMDMIGGGSSIVIPEGAPVLVDKTIDKFIAPNLIALENVKKKYVDEVQKKLALQKPEQFSDPETLLKNFTGSGACRSDEDATKILANILGEHQFYQTENHDAPITSSNYNPQTILDGFVQVSRQMENMPAARDRARRKGCSDFKLKN